MEVKRTPIQGVSNIIRFNWHFYLMALLILAALLLFENQFSPQIQNILNVAIIVAMLISLSSLLVSYYVYDLSDLYQLNWIKNVNARKILNINAGFDETSALILNRFPQVDLTICDFYEPDKHTEIAIKRARQFYPPNPETIPVSTNKLPFLENTFDQSYAIFSAHEIRNKNERIQFFSELNRVTKGQILVTEHLRDFTNFMAYTVGFFHFYSRKRWLQTFQQANLQVVEEIKTTPFITTFILEKNGNKH